MDNNLCFIQFLHPGKEHSPDGGSIKTWNRLEHKHKRKFLTSLGTYVADGRVEKGKILFWGEWEPESRVMRIADPESFCPRFIHEPFYVLPKSYDGLQNTDPFVFGECFHYAVCLQPHFPQLRHLSRGSVILFGSCQGGSAFLLDTVFVVDHWLDYSKANYQDDLAGAMSPVYEAVTMSPLHAEFGSNTCSPKKKSCTAESQEPLRLYFGATHDEPVQGMHSFFPCQPYEVKTKGFARPTIRLSEIADKKNTGIKRTYVASLDEMEVLWDKVAKQVKERRLSLGVYAEMPERHLTNTPN